MKPKMYIAAGLLLLLSILSVHANQQEDGITILKTATGYLLLWNQPGNHFTVEVEGKELRPLGSSEHVMFTVDGAILQVQSAAIKQFSNEVPNSKREDGTLLVARRDWETRHIESLLGKKLDVQSVSQKLSNEREALLWKFEMPKGLDGEAKKQIFLTVVSGNHVLLLNGVVTEKFEEKAVEQLLVSTMSTLKVSSTPIKLREVQESIRKTGPR